MSSLARRVGLVVKYQKTDISQDLAKYITGFSYTDEASDKADELTISLEDKEGLWHGDWLPKKGDKIQASFYIENWSGKENKQMLPCGSFTIDEFSLNGPPDEVTLKGQSVPVTGTIKTPKTRAWKKVKLSQIVMDIASASGLKALYECPSDPSYEHVDQVKESDIAFLSKLCKKAGISLKVTDSQLVLFDEATYEAKAAELMLIKGTSNILDYNFDATTNDTAYGSCRVRYKDPKTGKVIEHHYKPRDSNGGPVLEINEMVRTKEEARQLAMKRLRGKNKMETKVSFTIMGDIRFLAGVTVTIKGFRVFDGKYIIQKASHSVVGGYTTDLELTKCLEGY